MNEPDPKPWWKYGYVWLVVGGPAAVVVACMYTIWLVVTSPNPLVTEDYYRRGIEINKTLPEPSAAMTPALQSRNHAAAPVPLH